MTIFKWVELFSTYAVANLTQLGSTAQALLNNDQDLVLDWHPKPERQTKNSKRTKLTTFDSISAPSAPSRKGKKKAIVEDDPIEVSDHMYEWDDTQPRPGPSHITAPTKSTTMGPNKASRVIKADSSSETKEQVLYQRMLSLRDEVSSLVSH